jgi:hypothetical protein
MGFHDHVIRIKKQLEESDERYKIICCLTEPKGSLDLKRLEKMWKSLENRANKTAYGLYDGMWVFGFLEAIFNASSFPPYFYKNNKDRNETISDIEKLTKKLSRLLVANQLDLQLIYADRKIFNGFYFYENFGERNKYEIDKDQIQKLKASEFLKGLTTDVREKISEASKRGKAGKKVKEIRFIRALAERNNQ